MHTEESNRDGVTRDTNTPKSRGEPLLILMVIGVVAPALLIASVGVAAQWPVLAVTYTALISTSGVVLLMIIRLLGQSGEARKDLSAAADAKH